MKQNYQPENDDGLNEVLGQWTVDTPLPPRFQEQVWRRIAKAETKMQPAISFWVSLLHFVEANLLRPKIAYSYAAVLLLVGVAGGAWAAQRESGRLDSALRSRYVQSIDPYQKVALNR